MRKYVKNIIAVFIGLVIALFLAEIILRIYNPFKSRVRGNEIVLPANIKYEFNNVKINGLDAHIIHSKNSMGFRGPELSSAPGIRIFCVGGSTTECFYLSDGKDWPARLADKLKQKGAPVWLDNAGLDGHSTFGHIILLRDHLLKFNPRYVIFLVGCNDVAADKVNKYENYHLNNQKRFLENFELCNLYLSWKLSRNARKAGLGHNPVNFATCSPSDTSGWRNTIVDSMLLNGYQKRLYELVKLCNDAGCKPVFVTQPSMLSNATDPATGRYLGTCSFQGKSALHYRKQLDAYNQELDDFCLRYEIPCIALDKKMPSDSRYFYDFFHFTNAGAEKVADILTPEIDALLNPEIDRIKSAH